MPIDVPMVDDAIVEPLELLIVGRSLLPPHLSFVDAPMVCAGSFIDSRMLHSSFSITDCFFS